MKTKVAAVALILGLITFHVSAQEAITSFTGGTSTGGYALNGAGFLFTPLTTITVTDLGFGGGDLNNQPYQVNLWNSTGVELASATVRLSSPLVDETHYAAITPMELTAGNTYFIAAVGLTSGYWNGNVVILPPNSDPTGSFTVNPDISYLAAGFGVNAGVPLTQNTNVYPVAANLEFTVVPEPSVLALGAAGLLCLAQRRRGPAISGAAK